MEPSEIVAALSESTSATSSSCSGSLCHRNSEDKRRFGDLRGVRWRINLGVLPSSSLASIDDLRRVTADSRRRYAILRRRHLVDPHISKDGSNSPDIAMDNPLSQNPDSMWGRFFRSAELEKMVDQDLSRLYPEHGSYFQTPGCQGLLRRILLLWCLQHPQFGYRQGMHELLAPLLYVLHVDVERLSQVRKLYEDQFADKFDGLSFQDGSLKYNFDFKNRLDPTENESGVDGNVENVKTLSELDPEIQTIILLTDAYGAEGELGIVLSERFIEHDAYSMFDALMSGAHGAVAMADFFSPTPAGGSLSGLPPVIEASAALYHLLSHVDSSLHAHLVELGVEPQYFSLRWLRVLFGREFSLEDLLTIWDEIFASDNSKFDRSDEPETSSSFGFLSSSRGAFIAAIAVSMLLYLRSSLLATENATLCLQRLLNFPKNVDLKKLIEKAKSLQTLARQSNISSTPLLSGAYHHHSKSMVARGNGHSSGSVSPKTPLNHVPESYWEEKWRREQEAKQNGSRNQNVAQKKGWSEKVRSLYRTESDPSPAKLAGGKKNAKSSVRRRLLEDLSRELGAEEDIEKCGNDEVLDSKDDLSVEGEVDGQDGCEKYMENAEDKRCGSEENSSIFSDPTSSFGGVNDTEHDINDSSRSSVASNLSSDENDDQSRSVVEGPPLPYPGQLEIIPEKPGCTNDSEANAAVGTKDRKLVGKFPWFWKFGRNAAAEGKADSEASKSTAAESNPIKADGACSTSVSSKGDGVDQHVMGTLKNLGQSMLDHIQVIETVFQQECGQVGPLENLSKNPLVGKGQVTAMAALKELRKISNLLSEISTIMEWEIEPSTFELITGALSTKLSSEKYYM
ncbi:TBC1 domain family member 5-like isoform X1 [Cucurbita pepo subsp. pepo]|uniref:TBC1 domain family member 5-like isoform X1 n=1 Tax=Cucurbita pepo subsp. pepo TaxID=3664 RepID=UPI000C9D5CE5|nr:TBC1 domain family member 5-like isoform X1 [Cucurbita pepo subsp. pepo]